MSQENESSKRTKSVYRIAIPSGIIILCVSLNVFTGFYFTIFHFWKSLPRPPSTPTHIIDADPAGLWVETSSNQIYMYSIDCPWGFDCQHNQWSPIDTVADIKPFNYGFIRRGNDCASLSDFEPQSNPRGKINECVWTSRPGMDIAFGFDVYYVLLANGSILYQEYTPYAWPVPLICMAPSILLVLITVSVYLVRRGRRRKVLKAVAVPADIDLSK